ncbi:MAG: glycosyltransferase N-terminal domain-containing protein [Crocinitomicaceae bacterium]
MKLFYTIGVNVYYFAVLVASIWNPKAKKWINGRKEIWTQIGSFIPKEHVYWFHCASLGEFEQGRPLMEALKSRQNCQIVVTFFSPSGYEIRKNYNGADLIVYLPRDSKRNASKLLGAIKPVSVFFVKYEFWANYIFECNKRNIPIYLVAGLFRENQIFFKGYGGFMRKVLESFTKIYVQNDDSRALLNGIGLPSIVAGDTRYDRVLKNAAQVISYPEVERFCGDSKVLICGSIWDEDLQVIHNKINDLNEWKVIIAPHEISEGFIKRIEQLIKLKSIRYSQIDQCSDEKVLIIDNIGMLMNLYQYGDVAFVGGGYKTGLHNILEPAAFGLPVMFGDKFEKFPEAFIFIENGIGFTIPNAHTFYHVLDAVVGQALNEKVISFMKSQTGATDKILQEIIP